MRPIMSRLDVTDPPLSGPNDLVEQTYSRFRDRLLFVSTDPRLISQALVFPNLEPGHIPSDGELGERARILQAFKEACEEEPRLTPGMRTLVIAKTLNSLNF